MRLAVVMCAVVAGCGGRPDIGYVNAGGAPADDQAMRECQFEAVRASAAPGFGNPFLVAADRQASEARVMQACMEARGLRAAPPLPRKP